MQQEPTVPPCTLVGISYHYSSGMFRGFDFSITLSTKTIVETTYWPSPDADLATKKDVPITAAQWSVLELYPLMKPVPKRRREVKLPPWIQVMDGGDRTSLILTWNTQNGTQNIRYYYPNDRRFHTLITLLKELANPIGREIPRYNMQTNS